MDFPTLIGDARLGAYYDLIGNVSMEGGEYKVSLVNKASGKWYGIRDLEVEEMNADMIFLGEAYIQIWERKAGVGK